MGRSLRRTLGTILMALGAALLLGTALLYLYSLYEEAHLPNGQAMAETVASPTATPVIPTASPTPVPTPTTDDLLPDRRPFVRPGLPTPTPTPAPPTPTPTPLAPRRIVAPSIGLDAPVVPARLRNGEWEVPRFVAGHLEGTAYPGQGSNIVLSGHVQSLSAGNVFAHLDRLQPGDPVTLRTSGPDFVYRVAGKRVVPNTEISVVYPTPTEQLTLITCTGLWNPLTRDYSHRLVVVAEPPGPRLPLRPVPLE